MNINLQISITGDSHTEPDRSHLPGGLGLRVTPLGEGYDQV